MSSDIRWIHGSCLHCSMSWSKKGVYCGNKTLEEMRWRERQISTRPAQEESHDLKVSRDLSQIHTHRIWRTTAKLVLTYTQLQGTFKLQRRSSQLNPYVQTAIEIMQFRMICIRVFDNFWDERFWRKHVNIDVNTWKQYNHLLCNLLHYKSCLVTTNHAK